MVLSFDRWVGKVAIVTGASAGIGAAIVEQLVERGVIVAGFARRLDLLQEQAKTFSDKKGKLHPVQSDVSDEESVLRAFQWVSDNLGPVSILINNAGLNQDNTLSSGDTEKWRKVMETNVIGLCVCTREAVKQMTARNIDGHIIHINAILGHKVINFPKLNIYPASKFAVTALAETLRHELKAAGSKIKITSVSPGIVDTEFHSVAGRTTQQHRQFYASFKALSAEDVADAVTYALSTPEHVQIYELQVVPVESPH